MSKNEKAIVDVIINGETANKSIRDLEAAARKAKSELRGMTPDNKEYEKYKKSLENINKELEKTKVNAGLAASSWNKMKQEIKTSFIGNLGANLATLGLQKVASYFTDAWSAAIKLSDQMADIAKTTGMTVDEVKALNSALSQIDTRTSMSDLREIAKIGGQFGVAKDQLVDFVRAVDRTAIALGDEFAGGAEEVASSMSKLRNVLVDIKSDNIGSDIGFISNAINELAAAGVATGPVVADFANRIGGYGAQVGLTSGQILGLSATLQELAVSTERGGTAVVRIIQKMLTDTAAFAEVAGMDVKKFEELLNKDLFGAFTKVVEGSKNMGKNSTALAGIIKDLNVDGAGASEVFAKLGGNMGLLQEKVNLANGALTNTNSITAEAQLKNDNFAGSVERLSKEWNKLTSNPAIVGFFKGLIDTLALTIEGMSGVADVVKYNYDIITKGKAEADKIFAQNAAKEQMVKDEAFYKDALGGRLNEYKQHIAAMTQEELAAEVAKKRRTLKNEIENLKRLHAEGNHEEFIKEERYARLAEQELMAAQKMLQSKQNQSTTNQKLTKEELEKIEKENKKAAEKKIKELQKEHEAEFKAVMKHYDELISAARKKVDKEMEVFLKAEQEKFAKMNEFYALEFQAALDYGVAVATTDEERYAAEKIRLEQSYLEKMNTVKEGSYQYLLLEQELKNKLADLDRNRNMDRLQQVQEYANSVISISQSLMQFQMAQYDSDMNSYRKYTNSKKTMLKQQLDKGIIDTTTYNAEIAKLDADQDERERKMRVKQAQTQKRFAVFESAIKAALAWVEAYLMPWKTPQAIAATIQAGVIAAMPIPEFYEGGFMPKSTNDRDGFLIKGHANEYMMDARSMRDPFVMNTVNVVETAKAKGVSPSDVVNTSGSGADNGKLLAAASRLESAAASLEATINRGIRAHVVFDDAEILEIERKNKILIERGEPALGDSAVNDLLIGTNSKVLRKSAKNNL
jgi:TP901 family phage tail tape measure protein